MSGGAGSALSIATPLATIDFRVDQAMTAMPLSGIRRSKGIAGWWAWWSRAPGLQPPYQVALALSTLGDCCTALHPGVCERASSGDRLGEAIDRIKVRLDTAGVARGRLPHVCAGGDVDVIRVHQDGIGRTRLRAVVLGGTLSLLVVLLPALGPGTAYANGGSYPSNAPTAPVGTRVTGGEELVDNSALCCRGWQHAGTPGVQYYRVPLKFADHLTVNFEHVTGSNTAVCVMPSSVSDFTIANATCLEDAYAADTKRGQLLFTAPTDSSVLMAIWDDGCCTDESWAYAFTLSVRHGTSLSVVAPVSVARGSKVKVKGQLIPALANASIAVRSKAKGQAWVSAGTLVTNANGRFHKKYRASVKGKFKLRFSYAGSSSYLGSSQLVKVKVTA